MYTLNLPEFKPRLKKLDERIEIFDKLRSRYVALTPEEWVRQHFVNFLVESCGYKSSFMANEMSIRVGDKTVRADTVVLSKQLSPRMIIEYKAPTVSITQKTFHQALAYNSILHVNYLVMSNGLTHVYCRIDYANNKFEFLPNPPSWEAVQSE